MNNGLDDLELKIQYLFQNKNLLKKALTHSSFNNENQDISAGDNERFEFLGDALLNLSTAQYLFEKFPKSNEGILTEKRAELVSEENLSKIAESLEIGQYILLGRGEIKSEGFKKKSILANTMEAIFGAILLDSNFMTASNVVLKILQAAGKNIDTLPAPIKSPVSELEEYLQKNFQKKPIFRLDKVYGPDHKKIFKFVVTVEEFHFTAEGAGFSKKEAKINAAINLLNNLKCQNSKETQSYRFLSKTVDVLKDAYSAIRKIFPAGEAK